MYEKCRNKQTGETAEYKIIENSCNEGCLIDGNYIIKLNQKSYFLSPEDFNTFFETDISEHKNTPKEPVKDLKHQMSKNNNVNLYTHVKRKIYCWGCFYEDIFPYRTQKIDYVTSTLHKTEIYPDCKFLGMTYDILKEMFCRNAGESLKRLKEFGIDKIEIVEKE